MSVVSELDTGRLEAPKACVPTRGIDVDALGGQLRSCAGWDVPTRPRLFFPRAPVAGHRHPAELRNTGR